MDWTTRYLALLGIEPHTPNLQALTRLCRAHVQTVTFENVTALLRRGAAGDGPVPPFDDEATLAAWETGHSGGVCFEAAAMCCRLLQALGYSAHTVLGTIAFPGSHQAVRVALPQGDYLVDVACGSPILQPVPLSGETRLDHAGLSYRFLPGEAADTWRQQRLIDGTWETFCTYVLAVPTPDALEAAYQRHQRPGETWVTNTLTLIRCTNDAVIHLRNDQLTRYTAAGKTTETVPDTAAIARLAADTFRLPNADIPTALRARDACLRP